MSNPESGPRQEKPDYIRLKFDFSPYSVERLDEIMETTKSESRAEVIRNALRVFEFIYKKIRDGWTLRLTKEGEEDFVLKKEIPEDLE